ncbi:MAG: sporulation protein YqfD [Anaerovoracaceae bacterium]|uniref:Sporulation protein YqfD n=1 Tax=Candidatus Allocopromorpha excrementavium TaxID=2840741 RepID=A0A9D1HBH0_9FIRM|nr:sporulation protein YqfD [Candidatus Copromorpha excrementavium]
MKFGFLKHYRKIKIEGINLLVVINKCIKHRITLRNLKCRNEVEYTAELKREDCDRLKDITGSKYRITVIKEGGILPLFKKIKYNVITIAGAFLLGALIFYQSLFIAEIRVDGCQSISEADIRETLRSAGIYEGARKAENYEEAEVMLHKEYENITWASIYDEGRLINVKISETDSAEKDERQERTEEKEAPCNIVAAKAGIIENITPLTGNAQVEKGDYVNEGDILISGKFEYKTSNYSRKEEEGVMYSHAEGKVMARVPEHFTYYFEKKKRAREYTGNYFFGIKFKVGDLCLDTVSGRGGYEVSETESKEIFNISKVFPASLEIVKIREVKLKEETVSRDDIQKVVDASLRQYQKDNMDEGESILESSIEYGETAGLIKASVFAETLIDIGEERDLKKEKNK